MMRSIAAIKALSMLPSLRMCVVPFARAYTTTPFKAGDPVVHAEIPEGVDAEATEQNVQQTPKHHIPTNDPTEAVKTPPFASSPKLESPGVGPRVEPVFQQKRRQSTVPSLESVSCVVFDGTPLINKGGNYNENEGAEIADDDFMDYYKEHKPSPLLEIEFADTRLPITRATDGEKRDDIWGGEGRGYIIEDTVDEALHRAEVMFNEAREGGDPTMPHSQALLRKLRELYQTKENSVNN